MAIPSSWVLHSKSNLFGLILKIASVKHIKNIKNNIYDYYRYSTAELCRYFSRIAFLSHSRLYRSSRPNNANKLHLLNPNFSVLLPTLIIFISFSTTHNESKWEKFYLNAMQLYLKHGAFCYKKRSVNLHEFRVVRAIRTKFIGLMNRNHGFFGKQFIDSATKSNLNAIFHTVKFKEENAFFSSPVARPKFQFSSNFQQSSHHIHFEST